MSTGVRERNDGWIPTADAFGARLAMVRQRMGWGNVKEAALACGVPVESWRNWERDGARPRNLVDVAEQIAERTGCDFYWLLVGPRQGVGVGDPTSPVVPEGLMIDDRRSVALRQPIAA